MHCKNKWKILWSIKYTCTNKKKNEEEEEELTTSNCPIQQNYIKKFGRVNHMFTPFLTRFNQIYKIKLIKKKLARH